MDKVLRDALHLRSAVRYWTLTCLPSSYPIRRLWHAASEQVVIIGLQHGQHARRLRHEICPCCLAVLQGLGVLADAAHGNLGEASDLKSRPLCVPVSGTPTSLGHGKIGRLGRHLPIRLPLRPMCTEDAPQCPCTTKPNRSRCQPNSTGFLPMHIMAVRAVGLLPSRTPMQIHTPLAIFPERWMTLPMLSIRLRYVTNIRRGTPWRRSSGHRNSETPWSLSLCSHASSCRWDRPGFGNTAAPCIGRWADHCSNAAFARAERTTELRKLGR